MRSTPDAAGEAPGQGEAGRTGIVPRPALARVQAGTLRHVPLLDGCTWSAQYILLTVYLLGLIPGLRRPVSPRGEGIERGAGLPDDRSRLLCAWGKNNNRWLSASPLKGGDNVTWSSWGTSSPIPCLLPA